MWSQDCTLIMWADHDIDKHLQEFFDVWRAEKTDLSRLKYQSSCYV